MKRPILILTIMFAGLLLAPAGLTAQKVYMESGKIVLDLTTEAGMPAGVQTSEKKYIGAYTPSNTAVMPNNSHLDNINATVYQKLEVAPHDLTGNGTIGSSGGMFYWAETFTYCKNLNYNGTGWRLPTMRELVLMYIFQKALNDLGGTPFSASEYWSATEMYNETLTSWNINFSNGNTKFNNKTYTWRGRCVREL